MAKRGRKYQHARRVKGENAGSVVYGLPMSPKELSQQIDGRHKTRKIAKKRKDEPVKGGKKAAIASEMRHHDKDCTRSNRGNRWNSQRQIGRAHV